MRSNSAVDRWIATPVHRPVRAGTYQLPVIKMQVARVATSCTSGIRLARRNTALMRASNSQVKRFVPDNHRPHLQPDDAIHLFPIAVSITTGNDRTRRRSRHNVRPSSPAASDPAPAAVKWPLSSNFHLLPSRAQVTLKTMLLQKTFQQITDFCVVINHQNVG